MSNASFFTTYLNDAKACSTQNGFLTSVILAQWADETGYGGSLSNASTLWNFAGISAGGGVNSFGTEALGIAAYVSNTKQSYLNNVRAASGSTAQCQALGKGAGNGTTGPYWAASGYDYNDYQAGHARGTFNFGVDLISIIKSYNLTQYDGAGAGAPGLDSVVGLVDFLPGQTGSASTGSTGDPLQGILPPALGFASTIGISDFQINGVDLDLDVANAVVNAELALSITEASTLTLTLEDPDSIIINSNVFNEAATINFGSNALSFVLVEVDKQSTVLTVTFEAFVVNALRHASGPITIAPGTMTRTDFANKLVQQIGGAGFNCATPAYLRTLKDGYTGVNKEQLSRGTIDVPLEDSWTALQRLASEIQWVCFETFGVVYFGPYSWLIQPSQIKLAPQQWTNGVTTIDGTYNVNQPLGDLTINCVADSWSPVTGDGIQINGLGPFSNAGPTPGLWLVSGMSRPSMTEPDIIITCVQSLPGLPEPSTGGAKAAVGAGTSGSTSGSTQSVTGSAAAAGAVAFMLKHVGGPYSETKDGGTGPDYYDCSGLVQAAYASVGISLSRTTYTQWPTGDGPQVPPGIGNLQPGDVVFFGNTPGGEAVHEAMVVSVDVGTGVVNIVEAADTALGIITDTMSGIVGSKYGGQYYLGALRPAQ